MTSIFGLEMAHEGEKAEKKQISKTDNKYSIKKKSNKVEWKIEFLI